MGEKHPHIPGVVVVGFPYVRENCFAVFRHWPAADAIRFLLPRTWPIKGGAAVYTPPPDSRITTAQAYFAGYRNTYPVIGGLPKGLIPSFPAYLWRNRRHAGVCLQ